jgi:hypothetical protein
MATENESVLYVIIVVCLELVDMSNLKYVGINTLINTIEIVPKKVFFFRLPLCLPRFFFFALNIISCYEVYISRGQNQL